MATKIEIHPMPQIMGFYSQTGTSTPITNTTDELTLLDGGVGVLTVPANGFKVGDGFRVVMSGRVSCPNNAAFTLKVKSNTGLFLDSGSVDIRQTTDNPWRLDMDFIVQEIGIAGVASMKSSGMFNYIEDASQAFAGFMFDTLENINFDTTVANTLEITGQWGDASADRSIFSTMFNLLKVY